MKKKILIAGGTGFLGYHLCKKAVKKNLIVHSLSKKKPTKKRKVKKVKYICGDVLKYNSLKKIKKDYTFIINSSGYGGNESLLKKKKLSNTYLLGVKNLIKKINEKKLKKFIQIGTSNEYGICKAPQKEYMQSHPINNYGKAKLDCTNFLLNLFKNTNFPCVIFRLFQVYGPNQYTNRIIPFVINKSIQNQSFAVTKANQIRDFCYVEDIVEAIFKSLNNKKVDGKIINLGSSKPIQLKKLIELIKNLIKKGKPLYGKKKIKVKENLRLYPDITKAKVLLKWSPKFNLIRGVKKTIKLEI